MSHKSKLNRIKKQRKISTFFCVSFVILGTIEAFNKEPNFLLILLISIVGIFEFCKWDNLSKKIDLLEENKDKGE